MIPVARPNVGKEEIEAVEEVLKSGMIAMGEKVFEFERQFAEYSETKYGIGVCNGTIALDLALQSLKIRDSDEVITTPFTFIASVNSIVFQRAKPVFADIDEKTFNIDPEEIKEKITDKTKAIMVVQLYGQPADMKSIMEIAEDYKLKVIEDCAQAHGATYKNKKVGGFGDASIFSFYPTKNMTTSEGGIVLTNDDETAHRAKLIRDQGQSEKYLHTIVGTNFRMTNIQGAIGLEQLKKLENWNEIRNKNASKLSSNLKNIKGITVPYVDENVTKHVWHQYVIKIEDDFNMTREELQTFLKDKGIGNAIHYPIPVHHQPLYKEMGYSSEICPKSIDASKKVLSLPVHPLVTEKDLDYIIQVFRDEF